MDESKRETLESYYLDHSDLSDSFLLLPNDIKKKINQYMSTKRPRCQYIDARDVYYPPERCDKLVGIRSRCRTGIYSEIYCPLHKKHDQTLYKYKW
jgi:hypothetical protein